MTTAGDLEPDDAQKLWHYMSFSRFVWLLQRRELWLSRADRLGDPWEIALAGDQLRHVISRHPITPIVSSAQNVNRETAEERSRRIITMWRQRTFVSCWSASDHESHALWRIYCGSSEGVAIQTTFAKLKEAVGSLPIYKVTYEIPGASRRTPTLVDLVTKKRLMFAYEQEVRVVKDTTAETLPEGELLGYPIAWTPENSLESILVHPEGDGSFMETVTAAVSHYAPTLQKFVAWSAMTGPPPL